MQRQLRIMVLDTSQTSRKILEVILRREGHQVACFDDSLAALRFLFRHGPADLLFLGLDLPKMDGFDVLKCLRGQPRFRSMACVALLNEHDGVLVRLKARLAGAQQVVTKPLVRQRIVTLLSECPCQSTHHVSSHWSRLSASPGCASGPSPGSSETVGPSPGAS